ncbi:PDDEXK nuclease domain-containing protein [Pedobacter nototheniae]|uniref:PDDEXK nuclease domain-containing protein n=1 Tax=Pedobacter nototheniae TaxID=2488994 RepID=UPI00103BA4E1|nr:PDDEXK nuclease domain-containing protein [Pedobacter nototheniae]
MEKANDLYGNVLNILKRYRADAYKAVNTAMVISYWQIGKEIVENEQGGNVKATYGKEVIKTLSKKLSSEFGKGFSVATLESFRKFYIIYSDIENINNPISYALRRKLETTDNQSNEISYALRSNLSWTHHRLIMRVDDIQARAYYLSEAENQQWSSRELERNINSSYFQRVLSNQKELKELDSVDQHSHNFIKDPYVLEFLNVEQPFTLNEKEIEARIIDHLQQFLLELGKGFSFVGRQFRISTETSHFYIDLVFYNYILKCFVLFDLKTTKLSHQDIGQMDMYIKMFDDLKKQESDNPTIGIILCTDKEETVVKYSMLKDSKQLFASKYQMYLPTEKQLADWIEHDKAIIELQRKDNDSNSLI